MNQLSILICFLIVTCQVSINLFVEAAEPKKLTSCKAQLDNGKIIDLSSLDNAQNPMKASDNSNDYTWNPCSYISCRGGTMASASACQKTKTRPSVSNQIGDQDSASFSYDDRLLKIKYTSQQRTTFLTCLCAKDEKFEFKGESPKMTYNFALTSIWCCPDGKLSGNDGLSFGSVLLIIFFSCLFAYFVGGFIFLKFVKNSSGTDLIPNAKFWASTPGLVFDGFKFAKSKITSNGGGNNYSQI